MFRRLGVSSVYTKFSSNNNATRQWRSLLRSGGIPAAGALRSGQAGRLESRPSVPCQLIGAIILSGGRCQGIARPERAAVNA
jgi:hypothetical protein